MKEKYDTRKLENYQITDHNHNNDTDYLLGLLFHTVSTELHIKGHFFHNGQY